MTKFDKNDTSGTSNLNELTVITMTMEEDYAAIKRKKVETRRMIEDVVEAAKERRATFDWTL
ncbi:hypothetical protein [Glaciimonas soli]|uniref:Uncharacterized protein n=1 Tax=Glaciimonas soli TaxID=2590999 RepID=A0A843YUF2_9BURK|nr:hypothetical protein [Glaciimonas soli]MQR01253.1 hypothetical protein [Glaciimonas soli]